MDCEMCDDDCTVADHDEDDDRYADVLANSSADHLENVLHCEERLDAVMPMQCTNTVERDLMVVDSFSRSFP